MTPSPPPPDRRIETVVVTSAAEKHFRASDWLPTLPSLLASAISVYVVHRLTRGRDREKAAQELFDGMDAQLAQVKEAAVEGWMATTAPKRGRAIAETKWRLQRAGATVERLRLLTPRKRWTWRGRADASVTMTLEMTTLRRAITRDPFEDSDRKGYPVGITVEIEQAIGTFQAELDRRWYDWLSRQPPSGVSVKA